MPALASLTAMISSNLVFSTFRSFGPEHFILLLQVSEWEARDYAFRRLSFTIMRGILEQLIGQQLANLNYRFLSLSLLLSSIT